MHPDLKAAADRHHELADAVAQIRREFAAAMRVDKRAAEAAFRPALERAIAAKISAGARHTLMIKLHAHKRPALVAA